VRPGFLGQLGFGNPILVVTVASPITSEKGDSGGPYWERRSGLAVGTHTGGSLGESWMTPLESLPGYSGAPGSLDALGPGGKPLRPVRWRP